MNKFLMFVFSMISLLGFFVGLSDADGYDGFDVAAVSLSGRVVRHGFEKSVAHSRKRLAASLDATIPLDAVHTRPEPSFGDGGILCPVW